MHENLEDFQTEKSSSYRKILKKQYSENLRAPSEAETTTCADMLRGSSFRRSCLACKELEEFIRCEGSNLKLEGHNVIKPRFSRVFFYCFILKKITIENGGGGQGNTNLQCPTFLGL